MRARVDVGRSISPKIGAVEGSRALGHARAGSGRIDSSDEIGRVLLYVIIIIGVETTGVEVAPSTPVHGVCQPCWRIAKRSGEARQRVGEPSTRLACRGHARACWPGMRPDRGQQDQPERPPELNFSPTPLAT